MYLDIYLAKWSKGMGLDLSESSSAQPSCPSLEAGAEMDAYPVRVRS